MSILPIAIQRGLGNITVNLKKKEALPPLPYELNGIVPHDVWTSRVEIANRLCQVWSRLWTERIYFFCVFFLQWIIPSIVSNVLLLKLYSDDTTGKILPDKYFQYRAITIGIFLGLGILLWTPLIVWKVMGRRKIRTLVREWASVDTATSQGGFVPKWTITKPGIFSSSATIRVTLPRVPVIISSFHPDAALPAYINPPGYGYSNVTATDEKSGFQTVRV